MIERAMDYIETPRTEAGNATYMSNAHNLEDFSVENSFLSPSKIKDDLISQVVKGRGISLKTPRSRVPFTDRRNLPTGSHPEFTPILRSAVRNSSLHKQNQNRGGAPKTPAYLKNGYKDMNSPALPTVEASGLYDDDTGSSVVGDREGTTVPEIASSSFQSTPLAVLPKRDTGEVLADQGNVMTLREQENIINKIEKENFGLKLKIHFLEEGLHKAGPDFNHAALKENTDLKVVRVTLEKELARAKKTLTKAERELESYRIHIQDIQEKMQRKHADEGLREELKSLKSEVTSKTAEIEGLRQQLESSEDNKETIDKVKGDVEDLEAEIRERDRWLDDRDNEIDRLQAQIKQKLEEMAEVYEELEAEKHHIEDLKSDKKGMNEQAAQLKASREEVENLRKTVQSLKNDLQEAQRKTEVAREGAETAFEAMRKAENDLEELRDEMSNKSINTKGLNRQIEEKANKMQADLMTLRETHNLLQKRFDNESREAQKSQENAASAIQDAEIREQRLKDENELLRHGQEISVRKIETLSGRIQQVNEELRSKSEEKDLLHSRHDALTNESQNLQRELSKIQAIVKVLEQDLREEKQHSLDNDRQLRSIAADEIHRLTRTVDDLRREIEDKDGQQAADKDHWEGQRRNLFSEKEKAEEQAAGLQRTISKLQETEGTLSGREMKLKEALESEKLRFQSEEAVLGRQIQDLNADINDKRQLLEDLRSELSKTNDELRIAQRNQADLEEQVETLEDDVEVLQSAFDEEAERANNEITAAEHEIESLRHQLQQAKEENNQLQKSNTGSREGEKSEEQLTSQLQDADVRLKQIKSEKQLLQDKLANNNIELHSLRTASAETEAERDEMKSQVQQLQAQVDEKFKLDQEKFDLRKLKLKLENDVGRLREERKGLLEKHQIVEREFDEQIERGSFEVGSLKDEVADLQRKLATVSGGRDRELSASKQRVQRLEIQITELESRLAQNEQNPDDTAELSFLMKDLATARKRETEHLRSETAHKETIRKLKQNISQLERQVHEVEISRLAAYSPRSSVGGSARKDEIIEVRRQLAITHQQLKDLRANSRESEKEFQRKIAELGNQAQEDKDLHEQERDRLEQELSSCRLRNDESTAKITSAEKTVARLRTRIQTLEKEIQANRVTAAGDLTMADERKDLHEMLKDAKITAESLQVELNSRETLFNNLSTREKELRAHLSRVREERGMQFNKATALSSELESLQSRYENAVDSLARQQKDWEEERRRMTSGMRYPNMATGDFHVCDTAEERRRMELHVQEKEKRHMSELKGLAKQIQWLRAKYVREQSFREGLAHGKRYLLKVIEMHTAWFAAPFFPLPLTSKPKPADTALLFSSKTNLAVLEKMGIKRCPNPPPLLPNSTHAEKLKYALDSIPDPADKKPTLRSVSLMIVAGLRMQRFANAWAAEKKIKAGLLRSLEGVKRRRREASGLKLEEITKGVRKERYVDGEFVRKVEGVFRLEGVLKG